MYQGVNKGGGGVIGWNSSAAALAEEAFEFSSGNEGVVCEDPDNEGGGTLIAIAHIQASDGALVWNKAENEEIILCRTVAMSQMTSMLRDRDRNTVYENAIEIFIKNFVLKANRPPVILDIGTGTGLLAMLCARHGAAHVFAMEMFQKMASIAADIVNLNGLGEVISVIPHKSSDVGEFPLIPDLIVSELLDSALLGEAVIPAHSDAIDRFMLPNDTLPISDRVIPNRGKLFGTLVQSFEVRDMRNIDSFDKNEFGFSPYRSDEAKLCDGGSALTPVHWKELEKRGGIKLSNTVELAEFLFYQTEQPGAPIQGRDTYIEVSHDGEVHGILVWWNLYLLSSNLDPEERFIYSTESGVQNWQDHWVQVVFPLPHNGLPCKKGDIIKCTLYNDGLAVWLTAEKESSHSGSKRKISISETDSSEFTPSPTLCQCGWHMLCGSERIQMLNHENLNSHWPKALKTVCDSLLSSNRHIQNEKITIVDVSDGSILSIRLVSYLHKLFEDKGVSDNFRIISVERKMFSNLFFSQLAHANNLSESFESISSLFELSSPVESEDDDGNIVLVEPPIIDVLLCEPYFYQLNTQPFWEALSFLYMRNSLSLQLSSSAVIVPAKAIVMCAAVYLPHLSQCHGFVGSALGFDHTPLDLVQNEWDTYTYPYKIGDFDYEILTAPQELIGIDYVNNLQAGTDFSCEKTAPFVKSGRCDAVLSWVDYDLDNNGNIKGILDRDTNQFQYCAKVNVTFLRVPVFVHNGNSADGNADGNAGNNGNSSHLVMETLFTMGDSDIKTSYKIVTNM